MDGLLRRLRRTPLALLSIAGITLVCRELSANGTSAALLLLLTVLFIAAYATLADAAIASVAATLCLDYFFLPPVGRITIASPEDWVALFVFIAASLVASRLSTGFKRQRDELVLSQREVERQYAMSRAMLLCDSIENMGRLVVNKAIEIFGFSEAALFETESGRIFSSQADSTISEDKLRHVARNGSVEHEDGATGATMIPVSLGNKTLGSFGFRGAVLTEPSLQSLGNTVAIGLAQAQAQDAGSRAEAVRKSEELKSVLIDALAHDLKTPLTAMEAATDMLLDSRVSADQRRDLLEVIHQEVQGLKRMLAQGIHLARIEAKRLKLEMQALGVRELIQSVVESLGDRALSHEIVVDAPERMMEVSADRELISQALKQLIDNALKYSPSRSAIQISAHEADGLVSISVRDHGQGLTELEQTRVFDKFYRGRYDRSAIQGTGMGLAIAREIVEAHGGTIELESEVGSGSRFTITLRSVRQTAEIEQQPV